jgi:sulfur dioxygenase
MSLLIGATKHPAGFFEVTQEHVMLPAAGFRIIDVREPAEFAGELGHIPGAQLLPVSSAVAHLASAQKNEPLLIVCKAGGRSAAIAQSLTNAGFTQVVNLIGGMLAWNAAGRPVNK